MRRETPETSTISVIRFTPEITLQCHPHGPCFPDWVVCDTIASGSRRPSSLPGERGGTVVQFMKTFAPSSASAATGRRGITVRVLAEMTPRGCYALRVLAATATCRELWRPLGFFNRACTK
jgi:hypothetical protein